MSFPVHGSCNSVVVSVRKVLLKSTILDSHLLSTSHIMADSDRPRSPVPARNRLEPPGQRQPLPNFPGPYTIYPDLSTNRNGQQLRRDLT